MSIKIKLTVEGVAHLSEGIDAGLEPISIDVDKYSKIMSPDVTFEGIPATEVPYGIFDCSYSEALTSGYFEVQHNG